MNAMQKSAVQLSDPKKAGLYRYRDNWNDLNQATKTAGLQLIDLDFAQLRNKGQLLNALAAAFSFPPYCESNWDALSDALSDLSWSKSAGWVLQIKDAARFQSKFPADFTILIKILESVTSNWQSEGKPFWVIFTGHVPQQIAISELSIG